MNKPHSYSGECIRLYNMIPLCQEYTDGGDVGESSMALTTLAQH